KAMQQLITADWHKQDTSGRDAFLSDLKWWKETFPKLSKAERQRWQIKPTRAYRTYVQRTAGEDERRAAWLQGMDADARLEGKLEQQRHDGVMKAIGYMAGPAYEYRYVFDARTYRYEYRYVPK